MSPPQALGVPPLELAAGSPLQPFAQYCFACHRGNPARRLDFMAGKDEAEVLASIKATAAIRDALDWERYRGTDKDATLMPPADSHQRRALEAALAHDPQLLEEMRKVVPALFDF
jgi:mono/diheme cytochrome c family protein